MEQKNIELEEKKIGRGRPKGSKNKVSREDARKALQDAIVGMVREDIDELERELAELELHVASVRLIARKHLTSARRTLESVNVDIKDTLPQNTSANV